MCADTLALNNNGKRRGGGLKGMAKNKQSLKGRNGSECNTVHGISHITVSLPVALHCIQAHYDVPFCVFSDIRMSHHAKMGQRLAHFFL